MNNKTKITWEKRIKLTDTIIKEFPENFKDIINKHIDSIEDSYEKMDNLYMVKHSIFNCFLNHEHEYSKAELNYLKDVKKYCHDMHEIEGRIFKDGNTKGKLTPKQMEKYGESAIVKSLNRPKIKPEYLKNRNKSFILMSVGVLNLFHGIFHLIQFAQSMFIVAYSTKTHNHGDESFIDNIMHNPIFALLMGIVGIITLIIGINDYKHHKKCKH
jgi:hypothetical protein